MAHFSRAALRYLKFLALSILLVAAASSLAPPVSAQTSDIVLYAGEAPTRSGNWRIELDSSAAGGVRIRYPDAGLPKLDPALANPTNYFEMSFNAVQGVPYRLWLRGKADNNSTGNDSAWVQFSGSVDAFGNPIYRTSTTSAAMFNLEDCTGCGLSQWGWNDNLFGGLGPAVYFATTGAQKVRVQLREDGLSIDQIVLSPVNYLTIPPGFTKDDSIILSRNSGTVTTSGNVVLWAGDAVVQGSWMRVSDGSAAGQIALQYPDFGGPRLSTALASPQHYFDMSFNATAGIPYRLWMRGKAIGNSTNNDSVWVQFSSSLNQGGGADYRIGTTSAIMYNMEECTGCGLSGWGWNDSGINGLGPLVYFATSGTQTIRVQLREDGINVDQIVISPQTYFSNSPGAFKNDSVILPREGGSATVAPASNPTPTPTPLPPPPPPNQPPQVSISASATSGFSPLNVAFTSSAGDADGWIASYNWTFGDGTSSSAVSPSHTYAAGSFTARLTVIDNAGAAASAAVTINVSNPPTTTSRVKVLHWNTAYGRGTDNIIDLNRQANWMANMQVDLISLNEVPPENTSVYVNLLQQKTGVTWYSHWVPITPGNTVGQQILSRYPLLSTSSLYMSFGRSVAQARVSIGGRTINFFSTHLSFESSSWRWTQLSEMKNWLSGFGEQRIAAGDFNMWDGLGEYVDFAVTYYDSWIQAKNAGIAVSYPDNPDGKTRGGRIDFIFYSKSASGLVLREVRMPDQRDLNNRNVSITVGNSNDWGVRPSDHNFFVTTFDIR
jgi:endonuclease/exonuclease/phosphatase family metal-dependent hydrolase